MSHRATQLAYAVLLSVMGFAAGARLLIRAVDEMTTFPHEL